MADIVEARKLAARGCAAVCMETHPGRNSSARVDISLALRERFEALGGPLEPLVLAFDEVKAERDVALARVAELEALREAYVAAVREKEAAHRALHSGLEVVRRLERAEVKVSMAESALLRDSGLRG